MASGYSGVIYDLQLGFVSIVNVEVIWFLKSPSEPLSPM